MTTEIEPADNLFDYFHARVDDARAAVGTELSNDTGLYLATLLVDRARSDADRSSEQTLVELHARAVDAPPAEQARTYRQLGDRALYLVGYFEESLSRASVGPSYYRQMGAAAYDRVDAVFKRWFANAFDQVFEELSQGFGECTQVLKTVRSRMDEEPDALMRWLERWHRNGDEDAAQRLRERGLVLPPRPSEA